MLTSLTAIGATGATLFGIGSKLVSSLGKDKEIEEIRYTWLETLVASGCKVGKISDGTGKTFDLLDIERTPYGFKAISFIPNGLSLNDLRSKKEHLEDSLNGMLEINKDKYGNGGKIFIKIILSAPKFEFKPVKTDLNHIWIGNHYDGTPEIVELDNYNQWLIGGKPGTGKSMLIACILTNLMYNSTDKKGRPLVDIYYSQISKSDCNYYSKCKHTVKIINDLKETVQLIEELYNTAEKRDKKLKNLAIENIEEWNKLYGKSHFMKRKFLIIDEISFYTILTSDNEEVKKMKSIFWESLYGLARMGRSGGCHIITALQRGTATSLGGNGDLRAMMSIISLTVNNATESNIILGEPDAAKLGKRELVFGGNENIKHLIVPTLKNGFGDLKVYVPELLAKEDFLNNGQDAEDLNQSSEKNEVNLNEVEKSERIKLDKPISREELRIMREAGVSLFDIRNNGVTSNSPQIIKNKNEIDSNNFYFDVIKRELNTARDKDMLKFMENDNRQKFKALTLDQIHKLFYYNKNNPKSSYKYCAERLNRLASEKKQNVLEKYSLKEIPKETVYFIKEIGRKYSYHDLQPVNVFIKLKEIENTSDFKIELTPNREAYAKRFIPDALITFKKNGVLKRVYVEIDYTHFCGYKIPFYERMRQDEEFDLIIVKDSEIKEKSNEFKIIKDNFEMNELTKAFV